VSVCGVVGVVSWTDANVVVALPTVLLPFAGSWSLVRCSTCSSAETGTTCAPRWPGGGHWYSTSHHGTTSLLQLLDVDAGVDCPVPDADSLQSASILSERRDLPAAKPLLERCGRELRLRFGGAVVAVTEPTTRKGEEGSSAACTGISTCSKELLALSIMSRRGC